MTDHRPLNYGQFLALVAAHVDGPISHADLCLVASSLWWDRNRPRLGADWSQYIGPATAAAMHRLRLIRGAVHGSN